MFNSGFIALIGRPNVGKSTLMNYLIGEKMSIISEKPQTTRNQIRGILTTDSFQAVFIDTPGIHKPQHKFGERMVKIAVNTLQEVDLVIFMVDALAGPGKGDDYILKILRQISTPVILAVNKSDLVLPEKHESIISYYTDLFSFEASLSVSAVSGENTAQLLKLVAARLPEGPCYYPADMITDQPEKFIVSELIREKILQLTCEEIPHAIAVEIILMCRRENRELVDIQANIYVERDSQKGIIIGKGGSMLKEIGKRAREDIERLLGSPVFLQLWVKVEPNWRNKEKTWRAFGLDEM